MIEKYRQCFDLIDLQGVGEYADPLGKVQAMVLGQAASPIEGILRQRWLWP
jgi:hypothetical protein